MSPLRGKIAPGGGAGLGHSPGPNGAVRYSSSFVGFPALMAYVGYLSSIEPRFAHSYSASQTRASFSLSSRWRKESCSSTGCRRTCSLPRSRCRGRMSQCSCRYAAALPDQTVLPPQSPSCPGHARGVLPV